MLVPAFNHLGDLLKGFAPRSLLLRTRVFTLCFRGSPSGLLPLSLPDPAQVCIIQVEARPAGPGEPASVVMIGNSLFLDGVQVDRLQELTSKRLRIYPIFLEATGYYDWLYGLRRIFRLGARPEVVVVQLEAISLLWNRVRTEYSPMLFFDTPDLVHVSSDLGLGRTAESSLLLAHWSAFSSAHSVIRTKILSHTIPHFSELFVNLLIQAR